MRDNKTEDKEELPLVLAVDFDGTLVEDSFPMIGKIREPIWNAVVAAQEHGYRVILWSCRNGSALMEAVKFCAANGLHFDAINENLDEYKVLYGGDTRKVLADLYIDDRSGMLSDSNFIRAGV
jgi:hypothetical protein